MKHYVAIDIGGTNIKYGLINEAEILVEAHEMPTEAHKGGPGIMQKVDQRTIFIYLLFFLLLQTSLFL